MRSFQANSSFLPFCVVSCSSVVCRSEIAKFFEPSADAIIEAIERHCSTSQCEIKVRRVK